MVKWHLDNVAYRMYCNLAGGKKIAMPRYYKDKIYSEMDRKIAAWFTRKDMLEREANALPPTESEKWNEVQKHLAAFERMHKADLTNCKL